MYATTRKSYGSTKLPDFMSNGTKDLYDVKIKPKKEKKSSYEDLQQTRYINVEDIKEKNTLREEKKIKSKQIIFKNEFPVASVILTIVCTMMVMLLAFGLGNI